jgi:hypothetical protein
VSFTDVNWSRSMNNTAAGSSWFASRICCSAANVEARLRHPVRESWVAWCRSSSRSSALSVTSDSVTIAPGRPSSSDSAVTVARHQRSEPVPGSTTSISTWRAVRSSVTAANAASSRDRSSAATVAG